MKQLRLFLLLFVILLVGCETNTTIVHNVPAREANEIVVLLQSQGVDAVKTEAPTPTVAAATAEQFWNISVPASQITQALSILNQAGLPRVKGRSLLDLFGAQGLVPSDLQDRIRYQEGLSEQLANTIRKMDGIIDANVQITFPQEGEEEKALTASVYVKHRGILDNPNSLTITKIKRLVASAVPGLTVENVSVVTDRALYADILLGPTGEGEPTFVSVWGVVVAEESVPRFRAIFYTFIIILFIVISLLAWLVWKVFPVIVQNGYRSLLTPQQYEMPEVAVVETETESREE